jgi:hypothetical protein
MRPPPPPPPPRGLSATQVSPEHDIAHAPTVHLPSKDPVAKPHAPAAPDAHKSAGLSFAELWPESDRALVHEVEAAIAANRCAEAIDFADALVTRMLTSTATLFGSANASSDATNMPLFLGIDGRRYLTFRSIVRASRGGAKPSSHDALAAYAFAIEVRMARGSLR